MTYKKLIPGFGYREGQAVSLDRTQKTLHQDLLARIRQCGDDGADELFFYDLSLTDEDHERAILTIKEAARAVDVPIIAGGRTRKLEDIKKYLYAGAKAVFLDVSDDDNIDLIKEGAHRFGGEKIYALLPDLSYVKRGEEFGQLGASMLILNLPKETGDGNFSRELADVLKPHHLPVLVLCGPYQTGTDDSLLQIPSVEGMIFSDSPDDPQSCMEMKQNLQERGISVDTFESRIRWEDFKTNSDGLVPAVVQDYKTSQVLMLAYMNRESFEQTLKTGKMTYFSRSRQALWLKGETSGHYQYVKSLHLDCDNDTILAKVKQIGAACHTGKRSCFFKPLVQKEYRDTNPLKVFEEVFAVILDRKEHPKEGSYTNYLFDKGLDKILKKMGEEATEIVIAAKNPNPEEIKYEISDFLYHMMVLMADRGISWEEIMEELANR
ncbi:MAG: bifunctional phosphoribosyl-AMP cyclohydrolase/phosphoribosyl-ATP diphosphatase HisIE [Hungatella sp.]|nr:bifunctional phosphoribosyl-AMP cyclohydrolase/phosphoribosyl-ATP diphosphatase HisIE [Hungatella sp.]